MDDDRDAIHDLAHRYSDAVNRRDFAAFGRCFARDGRWVIPAPIGLDLQGRTVISRELEARLAARDLAVQLVTAIVVEEVDGDQARSRATITETVRSADRSSGFRMMGVYDDELVREEGRWVYARRTLHPLYIDPAVPTGTAFPPPC